MRRFVFISALLSLFCGVATTAFAEEPLHEIPEVVVTEKAKRQKLTNLNFRGTRFIGQRQCVFARMVAELNFGTKLSLRHPTLIRQMSFDVMINTFDSLAMRVVVYRQDDGARTSLLPAPRLIDIPKSETKQTITIDLSGDNIVAEGDIYVGVETFRVSSKRGGAEFSDTTVDGFLGFPIYTAGIFDGERLGAGIQVKGSVIK